MPASPELLRQNQYEMDREHRIRTDTVTWLAETLNGSMRTSFEYGFDGQDLIGEDGGAAGEIFDVAISTAQEIVKHNPHLLFELRRRIIERGEYEDMLDMAQGGPNTMVVVSDFPPELQDAREDVGGYNASRKQTMLRVITREANGNIRFTTQSLDGSNRAALEAIYQRLGLQAEPGELLGQRVQLDLTQEQQPQLIDNLTGAYDSSLSEQFGGQWHAGKRVTSHEQVLNTYEFANAQQDLIDWFTDQKLADPAGAERLRFQLAATVTQRFENRHARAATGSQRHAVYGFDAGRQARDLQREMQQATESAARSGKTFSGCGSSVSAEKSQTESQLGDSGYGNKTNENSYKFDKKMHCVSCQAPPKEGDGKKLCGPCGLCRGCDKKFGGKG